MSASNLKIRFREYAASPFEPDVLAGTQFRSIFTRKEALEPEKKLMLAVLEDAIACFQAYVDAKKGRRKRLFDEAEEWILQPRSDYLFCFENVCEYLGIDPGSLRKGLLQWKERRLQERRLENVLPFLAPSQAPESAKLSLLSRAVGG